MRDICYKLQKIELIRKAQNPGWNVDVDFVGKTSVEKLKIN